MEESCVFFTSTDAMVQRKAWQEVCGYLYFNPLRATYIRTGAQLQQGGRTEPIRRHTLHLKSQRLKPPLQRASEE
ncbi:hypothetical protein BaRGS_00007580 [Batillaria attramentaria]|uniref:Uncharacterized protein n=1 Tax=Batillaria attramentaria TaxID=370345 RepID=A0ABD0LNH8_9CAEN